ncbi:MAG: hypothetical protein NT029_13615 [Armatimonadetes bacterium]|nr:hypothetical protein [Armatimonadota bacterium]
MLTLNRLALASLALWAASPAVAQTDPVPLLAQTIHLDAPVVAAAGKRACTLQVRSFGDAENLTYLQAGYTAGVGCGWETALRVSAAELKSHALAGGAAVRHGGSDIELVARRRPWENRSIVLQAGVAQPRTPARGKPCFTLGASAGYEIGSDLALTLNPKAVILKENVLVGVGMGVAARAGSAWTLIADCTPLVTGDNTRSIIDGGKIRRTVYGAALRYNAREFGDGVTVDLGWTTGLGSSTGTSLTPGLGDAKALYVAVTARR